MIAVIDYGLGNLGSVCQALKSLGANPVVAITPGQLEAADRLLLPGVGSFAEGMLRLEQGGWRDVILDQVACGKPLLGICLGMQLLGDRGSESGGSAGLGLIPGEVKRLDSFGCSERIPHAGWNSIRLRGGGSKLLTGIPDGTDFYFVHSYAFEAADPGCIVADVEYGVPLAAVIARGNVFGTQFHPEKSSRSGVQLLRNFLAIESC
jgi:glutamine amidotransferase